MKTTTRDSIAHVGIGCVFFGIVFAACGELASGAVLEAIGIGAGMLASRGSPPGEWQ